MSARQEERIMGVRVGIVGVSGYGGSELLRLSVGHPAFEVVYASGESTAGQRLARQFPALSGHPTGDLVIQPFVPDEIQGVDVLFASLPTGSPSSRARVPQSPNPRASRTPAAIRRRRSWRWRR
jgi:N-acetyl-gamma-glutamyl-phosphate reductase